METRYIVKPIVCDYEVFDTKANESVVICNSQANATVITDILNFENERPNKAESWLERHDKEVRKQVCDEIKKKFGYKYNKQLVVSSYQLCKFLDQIEKGEIN